MRLLFHSEKDRADIQGRAPRLDEGLLERVLDFARGVEALRAPAEIQVYLVPRSGAQTGKEYGGASSYYLLVYSDDIPYAHMNAGYIAGQVLAYLCFLGIPAVLPNTLPIWARAKQGQECLAAVAFGGALPAGRRPRRAGAEELPCIYHDYQERWSEEVLRCVKKRFPTSLRSVRAVREDGRICIVPRITSGRRASLAELEAGIAAARIMTAAEELWMDLSFVDAEEPSCLVSVCRRKDLARFGRKTPEKAAVGAKAVPMYS